MYHADETFALNNADDNCDAADNKLMDWNEHESSLVGGQAIRHQNGDDDDDDGKPKQNVSIVAPSSPERAREISGR